MEFVYEMPIRFGDIDQAGIVYAPNFLHYYHSTFEEFFAATHGTPYWQWLSERRIGFPTVRVEAEFKAPLRYGDPLSVALSVPKIGRRSVDFRFEARSHQVLHAWSVDTKVCVHMETLESLEIPEDLLQVLKEHQ